MSRKYTRLLTLLALGFAVSAAGGASAQQLPGFGSDTRPPQGTPFVLPAGLEIAGPIVGADDDGNCPKPYTRDVGSGLDVRVCVPIRNRTGGGVTVIFPPGLVLVSASEGFQNGLLVEKEVLVVPPYTVSGNKLRDKEDTDIVYVPVHTYCLNKNREPTIPGKRYSLGPVSSHAGLSELYAFMADKSFKQDGQRVEALQEVVWEIVKDGRFTAQHRADLMEAWTSDGIGGPSPAPGS